MIKKGGLYSASDKAFFDALCQHKMSKPALQELLWRRGILKSSNCEKEYIARYFSRLNHDYFDHKLISEKVSTDSNREKQTAHFSSTPVKIDILENVAKELIDDRKEIDNSISFLTTAKSVQIKVSYSYYDHNKPEFKQLVTKDALISIESTSEGLVVRAPNNDYVSEITSKLLSDIEKKCGRSLNVETISLYGVDSIEKKISFFESLITGIDNMELHDVSDVAVFNPDTGDQNTLGVHVKRASLNGEGVLKSGELRQFYKKGFFAYRISWSTVVKGNLESDVYNFQAQFNDPEFCRKFSYLVRGVRKYLSPGDYAKNPSRLSESDEIRMMRLVEQSARKAIDFVYKDNGMENKNEED